MKLNITLTEAHSLVRQALSLPVDTEVNIEPATPGEFTILEKMIRDIDGMAYTSYQKILAIKRYREDCACSLGEAKNAIERWMWVRKWILENRRAPRSYTDGHGFFLS